MMTKVIKMTSALKGAVISWGRGLRNSMHVTRINTFSYERVISEKGYIRNTHTNDNQQGHIHNSTNVEAFAKVTYTYKHCDYEDSTKYSRVIRFYSPTI